MLKKLVDLVELELSLDDDEWLEMVELEMPDEDEDVAEELTDDKLEEKLKGSDDDDERRLSDRDE